MKFDIWGFFENLSRKFKFLLISDENNGHLWRENMCTFMAVSRWILLGMRCFRQKLYRKLKHILCSITFSRKPCRLWDNVEEQCSADQTTEDDIIGRMRFALCITKATDTRSECVTLIVFPRQQRLRERASMLRYTYISRLVIKR